MSNYKNRSSAVSEIWDLTAHGSHKMMPFIIRLDFHPKRLKTMNPKKTLYID